LLHRINLHPPDGEAPPLMRSRRMSGEIRAKSSNSSKDDGNTISLLLGTSTDEIDKH
jgi:hypothetical protein